ncbi:unnamed protein product [Ectocarpus sp. 6 AP-2014]
MESTSDPGDRPSGDRSPGGAGACAGASAGAGGSAGAAAAAAAAQPGESRLSTVRAASNAPSSTFQRPYHTGICREFGRFSRSSTSRWTTGRTRDASLPMKTSRNAAGCTNTWPRTARVRC